jgi:cholest-4-en-3-one 26-monooxygenase
VDAVDIYRPESYLDGPPHETFARLRRESPVHWQDMPGEPGYWAVLRHADVDYVARNPVLFSAEAGGVVLENLDPARLEQMRGMLLAMDPPRHRDYRQPLVKRFTPAVIGRLEQRVREICRAILGGLPARSEVEFVHDVAAGLPTRVLGELMGLPESDWDHVHHLAELITHSQDPDFASDGTDVATDGTAQMAMYAMAFAAARRELEPRDDLTSMMLAEPFGGRLMTDLDFGVFFVQLVTAGNDTTQTLLSSGLLALLDHPEQLAAVRADPARIPGAVEEMLRWANPLHYFRRTATDDVELGGTQIKADDKVAMYYTSANRDEAVFDNPQAFDTSRTPNPHLSFGTAEHFCLGAHLARLEARVFFEELFVTFAEIRLAGAPTRLRSNLNNAYKTLPIELTR